MQDDPVSPETAVDEFLETRAPEVSDATIQNLRYRLKQFRLWADDVGLEDMRELNGKQCEQFKLTRSSSGLAPITMRHHMRTFRQFVRWCGVVGYCDKSLHELVRVPSVKKADRRRDDALSYERANRIKSYLNELEYCTRQHIIFGILWHTGMRTGSARALDVDDIEYANDGTMYLRVRHRPGTDTPLKLGSEGERNVTIGDPELASAIDDWIQHKRPSVEDEYGRDPLLATEEGRVSTSTLRIDVYRATQPCMIDDCPHGQDPEECDHVGYVEPGGCPSAVGPHAIRRSAITATLNEGVPKEIVSERVNVNVDTLTEHYDVRSEEQARTTRQQYIDDLRF
ncbi:site-specific integrase [Natronolimnobius sp. AArcel1]|uniref:tyrosine-type recombinase/integrase n=1 Tax=Natronolimnobius sp. AArcel1 TaxID=1679093 RepID=UPI0013ECC663|nr:site-specific integrase [Natronolimnobius sp. AArcel1]NGM69168.1 site-specific integrase [Natronolimnobius sp. AArcel1]